MANGQHYLKFYLPDLLNDSALKMCSVENRWLWLEMLGIAHQNSRMGYVEINGKGLSPDDIARVIGWDKATVKAGVEELESNGVFSRDSDGVIFSRRMVRDHEKYIIQSHFGKLGGNPKLLNKNDNDEGVKGDDKGSLKPTKKFGLNQKQKQKQKQKEEKVVVPTKTFSSDSSVSPRSESDRGATLASRKSLASPRSKPTLDKFLAAYPGNSDTDYTSPNDRRIIEDIWWLLSDADKIHAIDEIPNLLAWVNDAPTDPERIIWHAHMWLESGMWREVWRRCPHLAPDARTEAVA